VNRGECWRNLLHETSSECLRHLSDWDNTCYHAHKETWSHLDIILIMYVRWFSYPKTAAVPSSTYIIWTVIPDPQHISCKSRAKVQHRLTWCAWQVASLNESMPWTLRRVYRPDAESDLANPTKMNIILWIERAAQIWNWTKLKWRNNDRSKETHKVKKYWKSMNHIQLRPKY